MAAVIALWIHVPPVPPEHEEPPVPVLLATPSVSKIILLDVLQLKLPWAVNSLSAFTIPSWCKSSAKSGLI